MRPPIDEPDHDNPGITRTDADLTSETRFGPRPVPPGHRPSAGPQSSRRIPPSGDVSPDGKRSYPRPSRTAKWAVWGGTGIAAAALTAGAVLAVRHVVDLLSDDDRHGGRHDGGPRRHRHGPGHGPRGRHDEQDRYRPRMQPPTDTEKRSTARRFVGEDPAERQFVRPDHDEPARRPAPRRSLMTEIEDNAQSLTGTLDGVMRSVSSALTGFQSVARQARGVMHEFGDVAELARGIFQGDGRAPARRSAPPRHHAEGAPRHGYPMPDLREDPLTEDADTPADHDPRSHRL